MNNKLLVTTKNDLSVIYFSNWDVLYLEDVNDVNINIPKYDKVYLRDPFNNSSVYIPNETIIDTILSGSEANYYIDRVDTFARAK